MFFVLDSVPSLRDFINFPTASGRVNLAEKIGTDYMKFGIFLLEDDDGDRTNAIVKELHERAENINIEVFRQWIKGKGLKPVNWTTVVQVLQDIGLGMLAEDVKKTKCYNG
jgi:hypothetical protein